MSTRKIIASALAVLCIAGISGVAIGSTPSPVQTSWPLFFGPLAGDVQLEGSDTLSKAFETYEPTYLAYVKANLPEGVKFTGNGLNQLDPSRLYFTSAYAPRVYFLYEETGAIDQLAVTIGTAAAPTTGAISGTTTTLFPYGRSCTDPLFSPNNGVRTTTDPLYPGDFVQLPTVSAGQQLGFILGNGDTSGSLYQVNGQNCVYYNGVSPIDNYQHMIAFFPDTTSQYIIIGFEDWAFGDQDCNDMVFVVDIGASNAAALRATTTLPK